MAGEQANIVWAVEIDASTGLQALVDALEAAQSQLDAVDLRARQLGDTISEVVTPRRAIAIDDTAIKTLAGSIGGMQQQFVAMESQAAASGAKVAGSLAITPTITFAVDDSAVRDAASGIYLVGQAPSPPPEPARTNAPEAEALRPAGPRPTQIQQAGGQGGLSPRPTQIQQAGGQGGLSPRPTQIQPPTTQAPAVSPAIERARLELAASQKTAEGVAAALTLAFGEAGEAVKAAGSAGSKTAVQLATDWQAALRQIQGDFDAGQASATEALRAIGSVGQEQAKAIRSAFADFQDDAKAPSGTATRPATVQTGLASGPIKLAREELLATEKTAEGVGAALRLAQASLAEMKAPEAFGDSLKMIRNDFLAGRATAEETSLAIVTTQRAASIEVMSAKRAEAEAFKTAEREKREAAEETGRAIERQRQAFAVAGQAMSGMAMTGGSLAATFASMEEAQRRFAGETEYMLHGLHRMQEAIPHAVAALGGVTQMVTGGPMGIVMGGFSLLTGIVGAIAAANKPPPRPESRKEGLEDTFSRIQTGALRAGDPARAQETREAMARHLASIDRSTSRREAGPSPVGV